MKNLFYFLMSFVLVSVFATSCSSGDDNKDDSDKSSNSLILSADKNVILADGSQSVHFMVKNERNEDVTSSCSFKVNNSAASKDFSTQQPGTYDVVANDGSIVSNTITITAADSDISSYVLKTNVSDFVADNGDFVELKLIDKHGNDVTSLVNFSSDLGGTFDGKYFRTNKVGRNKITASIKSDGNTTIPITSTTVTGVSTKTVKYFLLAEDFTCQTCQYCPDVPDALKPVLAGDKGDQIIVVGVHTKAIGPDNYVTKSGENLSDIFNVSSYPFLLVGRTSTGNYAGNETALPSKILSKGNIAISIISEVEDDHVTVKAYAGNVSTTPYSNLYMTVMLLEDNIVDFQVHHISGRLEKYVHNDVLRGTMPEVSANPVSFGYNIASLNMGATDSYSTSFSLKDCKKENCSIVVAVGNKNTKVILAAKKVKVGDGVGY